MPPSTVGPCSSGLRVVTLPNTACSSELYKASESYLPLLLSWFLGFLFCFLSAGCTSGALGSAFLAAGLGAGVGTAWAGAALAFLPFCSSAAALFFLFFSCT